MLRVLMVLEDYGELMFLQTVLKKIGFDVDAIQNPRSFEEGVLRMNPDLLVMTAAGKRVHGIELNQNLRRVRGLPRAILLGNGNTTAGGSHGGSSARTADPLVSGWLESPVAAIDLLNMIGDVCGLNKAVLQEKFQRLKLNEIEGGPNQDRPLHAVEEGTNPTLERRDGSSGNFSAQDEVQLNKNGQVDRSPPLSPVKASSMSDTERENRNKQFLTEQAPQQKGFSIKEVQSKVRELRMNEDLTHNQDLERERKAFVEHLFKK